MKKSVILALMLLIIIPAVSASINLNDLSQRQYNIGDAITVDGYIVAEEKIEGYMQMSYLCDNKTYPLQLIPLDMIKNERLELNDLTMPLMKVSSSMKGLCRVKSEILVAGKAIDQDMTNSFEVTTDLIGDFSIDNPQLQLGDNFLFEGTVEQLDGDPIEGSAELYFVQNGVEYLIGFIDIEAGYIDYEYTFFSGYAGDYEVNVLVRDTYGNEQAFEDVVDFSVTDELFVFLDTNTDSVLPGEYVNVFGNVKTITQEYVTSGSIEVSLDGTIYSTELSDSQYTYDLWTETDIKSGEHEINVNVRDSYGNKGSATGSVTIIPKATSLSVIMLNDSVKPQEEVFIQASIFDQAGDLMDDGLTLDIYDSNGKLVDSIGAYSGEAEAYGIEQFAEPGSWTVTAREGAEEEEMTSSTTFNVEAVQELDFYVMNDKLYITNIGNVKYTDEIEIQLEGLDEDFVIKQTKKLSPNQTTTIDLSSEVPTGIYSLSMITGNDVAEIDGVAIENGKDLKSVGGLYTLLAILFIVGLAYFLYLRFG
ncbi:MAG: hypothetical protein Q8Q35_03595, partial [Nanoarchaeota archaeon]|nr:hypothetical protein [Nanoarchaeota archaeon]